MLGGGEGGEGVGEEKEEPLHKLLVQLPGPSSRSALAQEAGQLAAEELQEALHDVAAGTGPLAQG